MKPLPPQWLEVTFKNGDAFKAEIGCFEQLDATFRTVNEARPEPGEAFVPDKVFDLPLICGTVMPCLVGGICSLFPSSIEILEQVETHNMEIQETRRKINPAGH